jgi:hypothetical protein
MRLIVPVPRKQHAPDAAAFAQVVAVAKAHYITGAAAQGARQACRRSADVGGVIEWSWMSDSHGQAGYGGME